jgi:hypothetical protein
MLYVPLVIANKEELFTSLCKTIFFLLKIEPAIKIKKTLKTKPEEWVKQLHALVLIFISNELVVEVL